MLLRAVGCPAVARVVNPAHGVVEVLLLPDARQVGCELAAYLLIALAYRVARETAARLEQLLAVRLVALLLLRNLSVEGRLPEVCGNRLALFVLLRGRNDAALLLVARQVPEGRHLRARSERLRVCEPDRYPLLSELQTNVLQIRPDLLLILHEVSGLRVELVELRLYLTVPHGQALGLRE